jgi:hypothetical protein
MSQNICPVSQRNIPEDFNFQQRGLAKLSLAKPYYPELHFSARSCKVCEEITALNNLPILKMEAAIFSEISICSTLLNLTFQNNVFYISTKFH